MGSFVLDFSAYNALLSSDGHNGTYFGLDDPLLGAGGEPSMHGHMNGRRNHHANGQSHRGSSRFAAFDRSSIVRLDAEKALQDRRNQQIANFGATWLKPPGVSKTLFQIREECREKEEQAEAERREELAQQLAQAEAEAAMEAEGGTGMDDEIDGGVDMDGDDDMGVDLDAGMGEHDLDDEIPDAEGEFTFSDNDDGPDPFASSDDDDSTAEEDTDIASGGDDNNSDEDDTAGAADTSDVAGTVDTITGSQAQDRAANEQLRAQDRAQAAAERREMRQVRATEDRMRAMLTQPRLSATGGLYGDDDDELDEEDAAQMLQEDDLVPGGATAAAREQQRRAAAARRRSMRQSYHNASSSRMRARSSIGGGGGVNSGGGGGGGDSMVESVADSHQGAVDPGYGYDEDGAEYGASEPEMDMDADMDDAIPDAPMDLSAIEDGSYEHTDTEAELSSSADGDGPGDGPGSARPRAGARVRRSTAGRSSLARSDRNSLDFSSLLSRDGSSNMGSSPAVRRL